MLFIPMHIEDIEHGAKTLMNAADDAVRSNRILAVESAVIHPEDTARELINGSELQTKLIQNVGRFCESYACDMVLTLSELEPFLTRENEGHPDRWIICAGIRENGVDFNSYIMAELRRTAACSFAGYASTEQRYRKVLAFDIRDEEEADEDLFPGELRRTIRLLDVSHSFLRIAPEDRES